MMTNKSKKQLRQEAIRAEIAKRQSTRANLSPLDRNQLLSLVEYVGKNIIENGHENNFQFSAQWARRNSVDLEKLTDFLASERINDDWDLAVGCDPFDLMGESEDRLSWMPLDQTELEDLLDWLDEAVQERGCNHDYTLSKEWLSNNSADTATTLMALMAKGGGCDCEIVLNVEPENIYP
ncbi:DUF2695 domain-containing protein [Pseudomaricurvus alkylphenolicus]|uniref:DUF2695 domain-containing protein n=1 Tax=Pseudomaricurvus alkylphenolicus TaxID=1306991 RepID=UPI001420A075|nr:DUF2695 domain-containing protein [Pseudomaricurvus alkylphenolicus]NIB44799.1 DUF2695 domain-containing protein [Pseudomaricurvus alkylphenolicus]